MRSCDQTCDGEVGILEKFLDRRHHLHLRQPGKNDTTGTDDGNGKNEYSFPEPSATLQDSNRRCVFFRVQTSANVVYPTGCEDRTPRRTHIFHSLACLGCRSDVCGFVKPHKSQSEWLIRNHGAFEINREELRLRPKDQTCHHEVWVHVRHVNARLVDQARASLFRKQCQSRQPSKKRSSWNPYEKM